MPRPDTKTITFSIDGLEVEAPAGAMLVDAAKYGDVEIPVFCYEPKLGAPVGACRMCLVEIEGIPKLQTACSTPVRDGMVVNTQTQRVHEAQRSRSIAISGESSSGFLKWRLGSMKREVPGPQP